MNPGEIISENGDIELNVGRRTASFSVANTGDRPIQVGSHYHFFETNQSLVFARDAARGMRLNIAAGTAVRFEPGQTRSVELVDFAGDRAAFGFQARVNGALDPKNASKKTTGRTSGATKRAAGKRKATSGIATTRSKKATRK